jgi:hypothetical protein
MPRAPDQRVTLKLGSFLDFAVSTFGHDLGLLRHALSMMGHRFKVSGSE